MPRRPWSVVQSMSFSDLLEHLGGIAPERVRLDPPPGRAKEEDVDRLDCHEDRLYELIDGVLVEKVYDFLDSIIAVQFAYAIGNWNNAEDAGIVTGASAPFRFGPRQVRMPDVAFTGWDRLPGRRAPWRAVPDLVPNLAVEVLNPGNTPGEMDRKLRDYFAAGVELVWSADPRKKVVEVYTSAVGRVTLKPGDVLDGGRVLHGFALPVGEVLSPPEPPKRATKNGNENAPGRAPRGVRRGPRG
jgi:Uma2 family endonuclease